MTRLTHSQAKKQVVYMIAIFPKIVGNDIKVFFHK